MKIEEALQLIESSSPHSRLRSARFFTKTKLPDIVPQLKGYLSLERSPHVKSALELAIKRNLTSFEPFVNVDDVTTSNEDNFVIKANSSKHDAEKWAGILLHEIEPKVGLIRVSAAKEIENYNSSKTKKHLDSLEMILSGFSDLRRSVSTPRAEEFDLSELITDTISQESKTGTEISLNGKKPFLIVSDKNLIHLALSNGIRNAIEAVANNTGEKKIVISWEKTDLDNSITIMDNGQGVPQDSHAYFKIGNSSKSNHNGFGLAIIKQSMENLCGSAVLTSAYEGGAKLELRWELIS